MKHVGVCHRAVYTVNIPRIGEHPIVLHLPYALSLPWQELLPSAGTVEVGRTVAGLAGMEGLSVAGAIVGEGSNVGIGLSLGATVDGAMAITVDVGVGVG